MAGEQGRSPLNTPVKGVGLIGKMEADEQELLFSETESDYERGQSNREPHLKWNYRLDSLTSW